MRRSNHPITDWFTAWPADALQMVAETFLAQVDLDPHVRGECVIMCQHFHSSVHALSAE